MSWTYEECTATLIVGSGYGPVGLDCVLRQGHRGPHRDSDGDVLWFPTKQGERSSRHWEELRHQQRWQDEERMVREAIKDERAIAEADRRERRSAQALSAFDAGRIRLIQGRRTVIDAGDGRRHERHTTMHILQDETRAYCGLLDPNAAHVIELAEVDPKSKICGGCSYKYGYDIEAGAHESGDPS